MTSSSHRRWTLNALGLRRGLPNAMSSSRLPCSSAAFSASCTTVSTPLQILIRKGCTNLFGLLFCPFPLDLFQLPHELRCFILFIVTVLAALAVCAIGVCINLPCLFQYASSFRICIFTLRSIFCRCSFEQAFRCCAGGSGSGLGKALGLCEVCCLCSQ